MRLDTLTIGSAKDSPTHQFKNLKNVTIDFDEKHWVTVLIGWNGTGKSNVLEALATIFRDLITYNSAPVAMRRAVPRFAFNLSYRIGVGEDRFYINIDADPDRPEERLIVHVATEEEALGAGTLTSLFEGQPKYSPWRGRKLKLSSFLKNASLFLPRYVFCYYSGESDRMFEVFRPYLQDFDEKLRKGADPGLKRLFYAMPIHSQFVLLAFLLQQSEEARDLLENELGIDLEEGIESALFVLKQPAWSKRRGSRKPNPNGDDRFWGAEGVVQGFLDRLFQISVAPIRIKRRENTTLWNEETKEFQYLFVKDVAALRTLVGDQSQEEFFRDLESAHASELIEEIRIRVRLQKNDRAITFRELSEGERQLLTVLGLLQFTAGEESLFLLDEPDTHINPSWSVRYLSYLERFLGIGNQTSGTSHVLLTTHNPLAIAELVKEQVQVLAREGSDRTLTSNHPQFHPRGMGFAGLLTSDLFQLHSSLDRLTEKALEAEEELSRKQHLTNEEEKVLDEARKLLAESGYRSTSRDPLQEEYLRARSEIVGESDRYRVALADYPGSQLRRRYARKVLLKILGEDEVQRDSE